MPAVEAWESGTTDNAESEPAWPATTKQARWRRYSFHHAQGQTAGFHAFAEELRQAGHTVHTPDLFDGHTFDTIEEGMGYAEQIGFPRRDTGAVGCTTTGSGIETAATACARRSRSKISEHVRGCSARTRTTD
jgi:hypothetical protein